MNLTSFCATLIINVLTLLLCDLAMLLSYITPLRRIAKLAGREMLAVYQNKDIALSVTSKADNTPVTQADLASHAILNRELSQLTPSIPILSEEGDPQALSLRQSWAEYWCVDPLDGTKEFIAGTDEFCICIALMHDQNPILGLLYLPITDETYYATKHGGAFVCQGEGPVTPLHTRPIQADRPIRVSISRRHVGPNTERILAGLGNHEILRLGSAIKFAKIAQGLVDIYPCPGQTQAWDSAAGQCIVEEAGGLVLDLSGNKLTYDRQENTCNPPFLVVGDANYDWQELLAALS